MAVNDTASVTSNTSNTVLTPTTTKFLTQLLESEDCIGKVEEQPTIIENDGFVVPLPPVTTAAAIAAGVSAAVVATPLSNKEASYRKSFVKLDSSSWQGCTTTVITPTKSENLTILDSPNNSNFTMKTRSTSRSSNRATAIVQPRSQVPVTTRRQANVKRTPSKSRPGVKTDTDEAGLSPEEAEKLNIRRERNKAAAARCRKRRLDQIETLSEEVEEHERKKRMLEDTIAQLKAQKDELEYILSQHQSECQLSVPSHLAIAVKSEPIPIIPEPVIRSEQPHQFLLVQQKPTPADRIGGLRPKRPLSLNITSANEANNSTMDGILIDTPSNVIANLGFDTLMTSTGLTPTTNIVTPVSFNVTSSNSSVPTCSSQQRSSELVLSDLNTPATENFSLVSL